VAADDDGDGDGDGVNDGVRSRGVKTELPPLWSESSPLDEDDEDEDDGFDLAIPSAGSGTAFAAEPAPAPLPDDLSGLLTVSSVEFPLVLVTGVVPVRVELAPVDPDRELPVLVRDDDMEPLSTTASSSATS
jgi:hypothetical protein